MDEIEDNHDFSVHIHGARSTGPASTLPRYMGMDTLSSGAPRAVRLNDSEFPSAVQP